MSAHMRMSEGPEDGKENVVVNVMKNIRRMLPINLTPTEFPLGG